MHTYITMQTHITTHAHITMHIYITVTTTHIPAVQTVSPPRVETAPTPVQR